MYVKIRSRSSRNGSQTHFTDRKALGDPFPCVPCVPWFKDEKPAMKKLGDSPRVFSKTEELLPDRSNAAHPEAVG